MIYTDIPEQFKPKFEAAGCFIENNERFLLLHRQDSSPQGNTWGLPSGKIKTKETPLEGIAREIREETGLIIPAAEILPISKVYVKFPECDFVYYIFQSTPPISEVRINPREHKDFRWVSAEEAFSLPLITDLDACIKLVYKRKN